MQGEMDTTGNVEPARARARGRARRRAAQSTGELLAATRIRTDRFLRCCTAEFIKNSERRAAAARGCAARAAADDDAF
jgi:hypothetical protein